MPCWSAFSCWLPGAATILAMFEDCASLLLRADTPEARVEKYQSRTSMQTCRGVSCWLQSTSAVNEQALGLICTDVKPGTWLRYSQQQASPHVRSHAIRAMMMWQVGRTWVG